MMGANSLCINWLDPVLVAVKREEFGFHGGGKQTKIRKQNRLVVLSHC